MLCHAVLGIGKQVPAVAAYLTLQSHSASCSSPNSQLCHAVCYVTICSASVQSLLADTIQYIQQLIGHIIHSDVHRSLLLNHRQ